MKNWVRSVILVVLACGILSSGTALWAEGQVRFEVAECTFPDPRKRVGGVEELSSCRERVIELELGD